MIHKTTMFLLSILLFAPMAHAQKDSIANHHDNFDAYDSKYHAWNSINVGHQKDIVGTWEKQHEKMASVLE